MASVENSDQGLKSESALQQHGRLKGRSELYFGANNDCRGAVGVAVSYGDRAMDERLKSSPTIMRVTRKYLIGH